MRRTKFFHQGDIIKMNFNPAKGHEQQGYRPALVVSNDEFNRMSGGMIKVLAISSNEKEFPLHIKLPENLKIKGKVFLDHERTVDALSEDRECKFVESVSDEFMNEILDKLTLTYKKSH